MSEIVLSEVQQMAIDAIQDWWYFSDEQEFYLAGYAGTGKSTIVKEIIESLGLVKGVRYCAFTGKAASVMAKKGNEPAFTIHSLIYYPEPELKKDGDGNLISTGKVKFKLVELGDRYYENYKGEHRECRKYHPLDDAKLLVLDECSMVDQKLADDLRSFGIRMLILGDPGQLPPIKGEGAFNKTPDFFLTEVHRQAEDSPILKAATKARKGQYLPLGKDGDVFIGSKNQWLDKAIEQFVTGERNWQFICGTNSTRVKIINKIRKAMGYTSPFPQFGEDLICLRNNRKEFLYNGMITKTIKGWDLDKDLTDIDAEKSYSCLQYKDLSITEGKYSCDYRYFLATAWEDEKIKKMADVMRSDYENAFDYSYCLTVHKAQGSEFENVVLIDESWLPYMKNNKEKWLYTGITRASERLVILR